MRFIFFRDPLHSILTSPGAFLRSPVELIHRHSFCANMPLQKFLACQPSMAPKKVFVDGWLSENRVPKKKPGDIIILHVEIYSNLEAIQRLYHIFRQTHKK